MASTRRFTLAEKALIKDKDSNFANPLSEGNVTNLYERIRPLITDKHREYLDMIQQGTGKIDPIMELEMNLRLVSILSTNAVEWALRDGRVSKDISSLLSEVRQSATAIEDINRKRKEMEAKSGNEDRVVDPTQQSPVALFENLHRESA